MGTSFTKSKLFFHKFYFITNTSCHLYVRRSMPVA